MPDLPNPKPAPTRRTPRPSTAAAKTGGGGTKTTASDAKAGSPERASAPKPVRRPASDVASPAANGNGRGARAAAPGTVAILARDGSPILPEGAQDDAAPGDLELSRSAIARLEAHDVAVTQGAIGTARAERVSVQMGALGFALTGDLAVSQSAARTIVARDAHLEQSAAQLVVAERVTVERGSNVLIVIARRVEGDVRAVLDWRGAVAFGIAFGLVVRLFRRGGRKG